MKKIKKGSSVLLLGKKVYLVKVNGEFHCQFGKIDLKKLVGKPFGCRIKTHLGEEFTAVEPNIVDFLKKAKRLPQVILPRDSSTILAITGVNKNSIVLDAGTGSGFLSIFLANYVKKVYTYERRKDFYNAAKENIKNSGLKNITIKNKDLKESKEKNVDLVCLDMKNPERMIGHVHSCLKPGGWLVVFSPYIEQVSAVTREIKKFGFTEPRIIENFQKEWHVQLSKNGVTYSRPKSFVMHTGFLIFARKL